MKDVTASLRAPQVAEAASGAWREAGGNLQAERQPDRPFNDKEPVRQLQSQ